MEAEDSARPTMQEAGLPIRFSRLSISGRVQSEELQDTLGSNLGRIVTLSAVRRVVGAGFRKVYGGNAQKREQHDQSWVVSDLEGIVNQGELLLVISPPNGTAATLVRGLASPSSLPTSFASHLDYGLIKPHEVQRGSLRSQVVFLNEHDVHFPTLSLENGLFPSASSAAPSTLLREGQSRSSWAQERLSELLEALGLSHARTTAFGNAFTQGKGLSGGERKRASVLEVLLSRASVLLLDSPTNGLDSSTALSMLTFIREWAQKGRRSVVVTAPQVSDRLLACFDRILVLDSAGRQVYFGTAEDAQSYFQGVGLGFKRREQAGEGLVEFIISCLENSSNNRDLERSWLKSSARKALNIEMAEYEKRYAGVAKPLRKAVEAEKSRWTSKRSKYRSSFGTQVWLLTKRQYQLILSELPAYMTKTTVNLALSVLCGTLFWRLPKTTEGAFTRGSLLLLSIMFNAYLSLAELGKAIEGRDIVKRQSDYGFFGASALALARVAGDLPLIGVQVVLFGTITYLLAGLQLSLARFAIYILFVYATALNLSCMFRMFAAFSPTFEEAIRFCGVALNILVILAGYFIPTNSMRPGVRWVHDVIDPISRSYEAVLANEFRGLDLACSPSDIVPSGPGYTDPRYQTCLLAGSVPRSLVVDGEKYLATAYDFHYSRIWFNLLVMALQALAFLIIGVIATDYLHFAPQGTKKIWARTRSAKKRLSEKWKSSRSKAGVEREEQGLLGGASGSDYEDSAETSLLGDDEDTKIDVDADGSTLMWQDLSLWVDTPLDTRRLLDRIDGHIKPGRVCSLLGASGAGKSTLLRTLAGRAQGVVKGTVLVDSQEPTADFYRTTGFVEQFDLHDEKATIRESLEFSALLRQDATIPRAQKLAYVNVVLDLLDLTHVQDAVVGTPTVGLDLCTRKLLSIAVEVVSKPAILFCDEPTTGLPAKSALRVIKLLKRLARTGLAVIATIHQPTGECFELFDDVLLLQRGGKQLYFGPRASAADYFGSEGKLSEGDNPAEFLLEVAGTTVVDEDSAATTPSIEAPLEKLAVRWKSSSEWKTLRQELSTLAQGDNSKRPRPTSTPVSVWTQCVELTKRVSRNYYRDVSFSYTKIFTSTVVPIVVGLTFYKQGYLFSIVSLQNRMFSVFLLLFVPVVIMNVTIFKTVQLRALWQARELPCKIYGHTAFATSLIISDIPYSVACATIYYLLWYTLAGFPINTPTVLYSFFLLQIFWVFQSTWALWIVSLSTSLGTIANLLPFFLVSMEAFNGSLMPYAQMPIYWKWLYWISPFQWYVRGMLGVLLHAQPIVCDPEEVVSFDSPPGQTCFEYAASYLKTAPGYLLNPNSTSLCNFCKYHNGDEWLATLNIAHSERWLSFGILLGYTGLNIALVYILIFYPPRLPAWAGRFSTASSRPTAKDIAEEQWAREEMEASGRDLRLESNRDAFS